ncbi:hypothetical protein BH24DEI2_BH24DEI2_06430 [soil metagenome]
MSQESLLLVVVFVTGLMITRWMVRLAPLASELPLKTVAAKLLAGIVGAGDGGLVPFAPSSTLLTVTLVLAPLYVFGPMVLTGLARARLYRFSDRLANLLYWTPEGRSAVKLLLVQIALQQGDADAALTFLGEDADPLMLAQAYALEERWDKVLSLSVPPAGDNALLALAARVQAYVVLNRLDKAEAELTEMRERWQKTQGPVGYRSILMSEARIAAERGEFETVKTKLSDMPAGVPAHLVFGTAARAAERAGGTDTAVRLYSQAYSAAPAGQRGGYADKLGRYGAPLPELERTTKAYGTYGLLAAIVAAYALQVWLDRQYPLPASAGGLTVSSVLAAFFLNLPSIPQSDALWRYLSYGFLHGGLVHLGFNAWVLFDIGRLYERRRSWGNLLAAFVVGTIGGALLTVLVGSPDPLILVGASGGILGLAGALLADAWRGQTQQDRAMVRSLVQWMAIIVVFSFAVEGVSLWGHVGGVVGGFLWGFARPLLPPSRAIDIAAGLLSIGLMVYALAQGASLFVKYVL